MKLPFLRSFLWPVIALAIFACDDGPTPSSSYYDERIGPVLEFGCVEQTAGCHLANDRGEATGNLDLSSFDALMRRADVLPAYGPYPVGLLFLKGGQDVEITVETLGEPATITTDIRHNAGSSIQLDSASYALLKRWVEAGFTRTGVPPEETEGSVGDCRSLVGTAPGFDPDAPPADGPSYDRFVSEVQPRLRESCAGANCHGSPIADLYLTCGDDDRQLRWNYWIAVQHLNSPVSTSELLRRPLAALRGGSFHEGGDIFASTDDERYEAIRSWAEDLINRNPDLLRGEFDEPGIQFFANRVQPVLVRKGCMFLNCHSPAMFHDLRLRGGSQGTFSRVAISRNYHMARLMLSIESESPNDSRIVAKNLYPHDQVSGGEGIAHRGGALFEDFGTEGMGLARATPDRCVGVDADAGDLNTIPAYCVLARWHQIEREEAIARGELDVAPISGVAWVSRPPGAGDPRDFDTFRGDARLLIASASITAGALTIDETTTVDASAGCGIPAGADVRTPAVSWDGSRIAFAARGSASEPFRLWWMNADGSACERIPGIAPGADMENGILTHDLDPAWAPDGRLVFASTRVGQRTPAALQPNANMYVYDPSGPSVRQLTFLLNQELSPSFMADGRLIMMGEKREPEFHQLAIRRQNLDGGDYHPLFAQRQSVGFRGAREPVELADRNFALVAGPIDATDGAGTIAIVNRSIGPDQDDRPAGDRFYIHSLRFPAPGAFGGMSGAFRSPAALPSGRVLVSCDTAATSLTGGPFAFQLCELDPDRGAVTAIAGEAGRANVEAVAIYPRVFHEVFQSRLDEVNGASQIRTDDTDAVIHVQDFPLLATLLFANTREGRPIDPRIGGVDVLAARPPPPTATSFAMLDASKVRMDSFGQVFVDYELLGHADLAADGSTAFRIPGGTPIVLRATDGSGDPLMFPADHELFTGEMIQREQMQFYPGERIGQSIPRRFFNGLCGGCHGSISGRELDVAVNIDVLTSASQTIIDENDPVDMVP